MRDCLRIASAGTRRGRGRFGGDAERARSHDPCDAAPLSSTQDDRNPSPMERPMTNDFQERARRLRNAVEPVAAGVYFAPEALAAYAALGFDRQSSGRQGRCRPSGVKSYFTSRGACMGQVPGEVVATAFGCFNPPVVVAAVAAGWQIASREAILDARERGATEMLQRVLGDQPEGLERVTELLRRGLTQHHGLAARSTRGCGRSATRPPDGCHVASRGPVAGTPGRQPCHHLVGRRCRRRGDPPAV